jgi:FKBP-type peptidyl-prolyl cis-trans isomerase FklB
MRSIALFALALPLMACEGITQEKPVLRTELDSVSYSIGRDIGKNMAHQEIEINPTMVAQGMQDALTPEGTPLMTEEEVNACLSAFAQKLTERNTPNMNGEKNRMDGEAFLAANAKAKDVVTLPSGLQYKVITSGTGQKPKATDVVTVHYTGTLTDGTVFDSSRKRGEPASFAVNGVIKGWVEGLQLMNEGSKWMLYIPPDLAYGPSGAGSVIGPNMTLIFEVELLAIK